MHNGFRTLVLFEMIPDICKTYVLGDGDEKHDQNNSHCTWCSFTLTRHTPLNKSKCKGESGSFFFTYEYIICFYIFIALFLLNRNWLIALKRHTQQSNLCKINKEKKSDIGTTIHKFTFWTKIRLQKVEEVTMLFPFHWKEWNFLS